MTTTHDSRRDDDGSDESSSCYDDDDDDDSDPDTEHVTILDTASLERKDPFVASFHMYNNDGNSSNSPSEHNVFWASLLAAWGKRRRYWLARWVSSTVFCVLFIMMLCTLIFAMHRLWYVELFAHR
jgi:hypothetical protein